jgi:hypothetical protein
MTPIVLVVFLVANWLGKEVHHDARDDREVAA